MKVFTIYSYYCGSSDTYVIACESKEEAIKIYEKEVGKFTDEDIFEIPIGTAYHICSR